MVLDLPIVWVIALNTVLWPILQIGLAWGFTAMPAAWFSPPGKWVFPGESPMFYERSLRIKLWKDWLPDGASWFAGGIPKSRLTGGDAAGLETFAIETWRGELCHWATLAMTPLFFLWNPAWADVVMVVYAVISNLPCVVVQRYNRLRIRHVVSTRTTPLSRRRKG